MDWHARLTRAEKRGKFAKADLELAGPWLSCVVGEHKGQYRVQVQGKWAEPGEPSAAGLHTLGFEFYCAVLDESVDDAREIYDAIQAWFQRYGKKVGSA